MGYEEYYHTEMIHDTDYATLQQKIDKMIITKLTEGFVLNSVIPSYDRTDDSGQFVFAGDYLLIFTRYSN